MRSIPSSLDFYIEIGYLHRLGREANQGEVGLVLDGHYIGISKYEEE